MIHETFQRNVRTFIFNARTFQFITNILNVFTFYIIVDGKDL